MPPKKRYTESSTDNKNNNATDKKDDVGVNPKRQKKTNPTAAVEPESAKSSSSPSSCCCCCCGEDITSTSRKRCTKCKRAFHPACARWVHQYDKKEPYECAYCRMVAAWEKEEKQKPTKGQVLLHPSAQELLDRGFSVMTESRARSSAERSPVAFPESTVERLSDRVIEDFERLLDAFLMQDKVCDLTQGFKNLRERGQGRYEVIPSWLQEFWETEKKENPLVRDVWARIEDVVQSTLCHEAVPIAAGVFIAFPGAENQKYHTDGPALIVDAAGHSHEALRYPHAVNVFIPLCDVGPKNGTEFYPGSHVENPDDDATIVRSKAETPTVPSGGVYMFDYRVRHRGRGNTLGTARPCAYITFARSWYRDTENFSATRYKMKL
eukprot:PhM_4_TR2868/c1_g1_i1/m.40763